MRPPINSDDDILEGRMEIEMPPSNKRRHKMSDESDGVEASDRTHLRPQRRRKLTECARLAAEQSDSDIEVDPVITYFRKRKNSTPSEQQQKLARWDLISFVSSFLGQH